jgi:hypothetical protein
MILQEYARHGSAPQSRRSALEGLLRPFRRGPVNRLEKAGTINSVSLDELHGLRISIAGHKGRWPISTVKFSEGS